MKTYTTIQNERKYSVSIQTNEGSEDHGFYQTKKLAMKLAVKLRHFPSDYALFENPNVEVYDCENDKVVYRMPIAKKWMKKNPSWAN